MIFKQISYRRQRVHSHCWRNHLHVHNPLSSLISKMLVSKIYTNTNHPVDTWQTLLYKHWIHLYNHFLPQGNCLKHFFWPKPLQNCSLYPKSKAKLEKERSFLMTYLYEALVATDVSHPTVLIYVSSRICITKIYFSTIFRITIQ